jgi:hypothetical protein
MRLATCGAFVFRTRRRTDRFVPGKALPQTAGRLDSRRSRDCLPAEAIVQSRSVATGSQSPLSMDAIDRLNPQPIGDNPLPR